MQQSRAIVAGEDPIKSAVHQRPSMEEWTEPKISTQNQEAVLSKSLPEPQKAKYCYLLNFNFNFYHCKGKEVCVCGGKDEHKSNKTII
jgi:hypothetical protein